MNNHKHNLIDANQHNLCKSHLNKSHNHSNNQHNNQHGCSVKV